MDITPEVTQQLVVAQWAENEGVLCIPAQSVDSLIWWAEQQGRIAIYNPTTRKMVPNGLTAETMNRLRHTFMIERFYLIPNMPFDIALKTLDEIDELLDMK